MPLKIETQPIQLNSSITGLDGAIFNSVSAVSLSGTHFGDGSNLTGLYQGTDLKNLSGNWQSTFGTVSSLSANWNSAFNTATTYQNASGTFATNTLLQSTSALLTPLTLTRTLTGQLVLNTDSRLSDARTPTAHASTHGQSGDDSIAIPIVSLNTTQILEGSNLIPIGFIGRTNDFNGFPQWFGNTLNNNNYLIAYRSMVDNRWVLCGAVYDYEANEYSPDFGTIYAESTIVGGEYPWRFFGGIQQYTNGIKLRSGAYGTSYLDQYGSRGLAETYAISDHSHPLPTLQQLGADSTYAKLSSNVFTYDPSVSSINTVNGNNIASGVFSGVLGGNRNTASGRYSTIVGGFSSCATGFSTFVGAGSGNRATGDYAVVGGGVTNSNFAPNSVIGGGTGNIICNNSNIPGNTIGGGLLNVIGSNATCANTIGGGGNNCANGRYATIAGGFNNLSNTFCTTVGGGASNQATGTFAVVGGGVFNCATSTSTTVAGGCCNCATSAGSTVAGGQNNRAIGAYSTVSGGYNNNASGLGAANGMTAIVGGRQNSTTTSSAYAFIGGGCLNVVGGVNSLIAGGLGNFNPLRDSIIGGGVANHTGGFAPFNITAAASISGNGTQTRLTGTGIQSLFSFPFTSGNVSLYYATPTVPLSSGTFTTATIAATGTNFIVVNGDYSTCTPTGLSATSIFVYDRAINNTGWNNTIAGGKLNTASGCYGFIGGGLNNNITNLTIGSSIVGGSGNNITSNVCGCQNTILGGTGNLICGNTRLATILNGSGNIIASAQYGTASGYQNCVLNQGGVAIGASNRACGGWSISLGQGNTSCGCRSTISGVYGLVNGPESTVIGGCRNSLVGSQSFIGAGVCNVQNSNFSSIVGGRFNYNPLYNSNIGGGSFNHTGGFVPNNILTTSISGNGTNTALIQSGIGSCFSASNTTGAVTLVWMTSGTANSSLSSANFTTANVVTNAANCIIINGDYSTCTATGLSACSIYVYDRCLNNTGRNNFIGGGVLNTASGNYSTVGGGICNTTNTSSGYNVNTIAGGICNLICANSSAGFIGGGSGNCLTGTGGGGLGGAGIIAGGFKNTAAGNNPTIAGGASNIIFANGSFIGGGLNNCICNCTGGAHCSVIAGGCINRVLGSTFSVIAGGGCNTVSGTRSVITGGSCNTASGNYSFVAGGSANNTMGFANTFILGTALSASKANYTYVNNLSVQGNIESNTNYVATLSLTANQTANNASDTVITLDPLNDPNNWFNRSTRRFTPTIPGYYHVDYQVAWDSGTAGSGNQNNIQIRRNTTSVALAQQPINDSNVNTTQNTADIAFLNGTTDYLEFTAYSSNAAQNIVGTSDGAWTKVEVFKIN